MVLNDLLRVTGNQRLTVLKDWRDKDFEWTTFSVDSDSQEGLTGQIEQLKSQVGLCGVAAILVQNNKLIICLKDSETPA